jgi:mannose-6-phosphate isomerase-like protein (cupin superfamily)
VNDAYVEVAKVRGSLARHRHEGEDEHFLALKGRLRIELEAGIVELGEGERFVVPKSVLHNPVAEEECHLLLIEPKATQHTRDTVTERTRRLAGLARDGAQQLASAISPRAGG